MPTQHKEEEWENEYAELCGFQEGRWDIQWVVAQPPFYDLPMQGYISGFRDGSIHMVESTNQESADK